MEHVIADLTWYAVGAFALGFIVAWVVCANPSRAVATAALVEEEEEERRGLFHWARRGYRIYDKSTGWWDRINWLLGLFKTNAGVAALVATTAAGGTYAAMEIRENVILPAKLKMETAALKPQEEVRQTRNSVVFAIKGKDKAGREGSFDVVVLNKSFLWARGSADTLEKDGQTIAGADLASAVLDDEVRAALADAKEVIAVGTASQEGNATDEIARAERRAQTAANLAAGAVAADIPLWTLNLGQYRDPCQNCETSGTSWQRPFIVIAVRSLEPDTNLGEALADAMSGKQKLPSPESYSAFSLTRFR